MTTPGTPAALPPASPPFLSRGRCWLLGLMLAGTAVFASLVWAHGYTRAWHAWSFVSAGEPFLDLRVITAGAESHARGFDPLLENPCDPMQRRMNYPRTWHALFAFGLTQRHTVPLGAGIAAAFLLSVLLFPRGLDRRTAVGLGFGLFSSAVMLCLERGNIDLVLFTIVALALFVLPRNAAAATGILFAGFTLKLYPILGLVALLRENRRRFLLLTAGAAIAVAAYLLWFRADLQAIRAATPSVTWLSYGLVTATRALSENLATAPSGVLPGAQIIGITLLLALFAAVVWRISHHAGEAAANDPASPNIDAFRAGAGIYAGTFLLGSNFDYRLVFLLFTIPQLCDWSRNNAGERRRASLLTLAAIYLTLWQQLWKPWITPDGGAVWWSAALPTLLEQAGKCTIFAGSTYLLTTSAPTWLGRWLAPWISPAAKAARILRTAPLFSAVLLLGIAGLCVKTGDIFMNRGHDLAAIGGSRPQRDALLTQAIFSGDNSRVSELWERDVSLHPHALTIGTLAKFTTLPVGRAAGMVFIGGLALCLAAAWQLARRWAVSAESGALILATTAWCPAFGFNTPAWRLEVLVVAGAAWAGVLILRGFEARGAPRLRSWGGALVLGVLPAWEVMVRGSSAAALALFGISLLAGWAAARLLATRWPRAAVWPVALLLPLVPMLALRALPAGVMRSGYVAPPGLITALREFTPPQASCLIIGDESFQLMALPVGRRSRLWEVPAGASAEPVLAELEQLPIGALIVQQGAALDPAHLAALASRLNLDDTPTFEHPAASVYLSRFARESAVGRLAQPPSFDGVTTIAKSEGAASPELLRVVPPGLADYAFPMIQPRPTHYNLTYGYDRWSVDGVPALRAHARSEVRVPAPSTAQRIRWDFGLLPDSYQRTGGTNGVVFLLEGELPSGERRVLFRRVLDPTSMESDRGPQSATIPFVPRAGERLVFQSLDNGNGAFDWSYWRRIRVD